MGRHEARLRNRRDLEEVQPQLGEGKDHERPGSIGPSCTGAHPAVACLVKATRELAGEVFYKASHDALRDRVPQGGGRLVVACRRILGGVQYSRRGSWPTRVAK